MERCKDCELAIYCYSDASSWIFRTTREMAEKTEAIANCPLHAEVERMIASRRAKKDRVTQ